MPFKGVVDSQQLAILVDVFDNYCAVLGISPEDPARQDIAEIIMALHCGGLDGRTELLSALSAETGKDLQRLTGPERR